MARKGSLYFGHSLYGMQAILQMARMLAERHRELPRVQSLLTMVEDADKELTKAAHSALQHERSGRASQETEATP